MTRLKTQETRQQFLLCAIVSVFGFLEGCHGPTSSPQEPKYMEIRINESSGSITFTRTDIPNEFFNSEIEFEFENGLKLRTPCYLEAMKGDVSWEELEALPRHLSPPTYMEPDPYLAKKMPTIRQAKFQVDPTKKFEGSYIKATIATRVFPIKFSIITNGKHGIHRDIVMIIK